MHFFFSLLICAGTVLNTPFDPWHPLGTANNGVGVADTLPETNQRVLAFAKAHMGTRVGSGQCWDLAAQALNAAHARWDGAYGFGRVMDPRKETVLPGDIVQFEGVEVGYAEPGRTTRESMGHHTAIIYAVHGEGDFTLIHQNFGKAGTRVGTTEWSEAHVTKGRYTFFRPQR